MKNRDLIIKIARRLDKFSLNELIVVSELEEQEVTDILSELQNEQIIIKNNSNYFFNNKKTDEINSTVTSINGIKPIIIEQEEGYDYFITLSKETQAKIRGYVELINLVRQTGRKKLRQVINFFNETHEYKKISYSAFYRIYKNFNNYGFAGILPHFYKNFESSIPDEIYSYFKKYYLNKEKLSAAEALFKAQKQLQKEQKLEQPYAYNANSFIRKIKYEFKKEQIEYFRNNINPPRTKIKTTDIKEPLDMPFKKAAKIYLNRLKNDKLLDKLMHEKTDYKNHLKDVFDNLEIREITPKIIADYKQSKFDSGFQLTSVNTYINILKSIIKSVCPKTNNLITRKDKTRQNSYALDMNILSKHNIKKFLKLCFDKYPEVYPVFYIALSTGASIPELLGLTWDRINFEDNTIFLKYFLYGERLIMNKCGSTIRKLKIDDKIKNILQNKFNEFKPALTDFVFKFDTKKLMQQYIEENILIPLSKELGISKLYPSDIQHNFVNLCLNQNIPLTFIQKSLGYFGIVNFIRIYRNLIEKSEKENYNPLEKLNVI